MLQHLYIRDFAIVKALELDFEAGLTVLTGETGAGKSIVVDALALVLGERAEGHVIRAGSSRTEVGASFALKPAQPAAKWLRENDLFEDGECVLRRVIESDKPSRAFINGRPVSVQQLRAFGELLVDIHGQHEHQSLLSRDVQLDLLDAYGELTETVERLGAQYETWRALRERLDRLQRESADRETRVDFLRHQVRELQALALKPGEMALLEEEHARLAHGAELIEGTQEIAQSLFEAEEGAAREAIARAVSRIESLARLDPRLAESGELLNQAGILLDEAADRLRHYQDGLDPDPARLQQLENRLGTAHDLARKHRVPPDELPALAERLARELDELDNYEGSLAKLEEQVNTARAAYDAQAAAISRARAQAAKKLAKAVTEHMHELGMPGGQFEIALTPLPEGGIGARGVERAEFLVTANPGQPPRPLAKVASGGELSRISLAIQVVLANLAAVPTLIFDEVDVGVGGRVAEIVGQRLRRLGKSRQVLVITHLAQVAALGHYHLQVSKKSRGAETTAEVRPLKDLERVQEIARMIGGVTISPQTLAHAEDMLARASV
jgi:DNA repair protein RecN (Recombination protein N)